MLSNNKIHILCITISCLDCFKIKQQVKLIMGLKGDSNSNNKVYHWIEIQYKVIIIYILMISNNKLDTQWRECLQGNRFKMILKLRINL